MQNFCSKDFWSIKLFSNKIPETFSFENFCRKYQNQAPNISWIDGQAQQVKMCFLNEDANIWLIFRSTSFFFTECKLHLLCQLSANAILMNTLLYYSFRRFFDQFSADGWWQAKRIQKCQNECTFTLTALPQGNNGCKKWSPFTNSNWATTYPTNTAL